jgi:hypothetical protein
MEGPEPMLSRRGAGTPWKSIMRLIERHIWLLAQSRNPDIFRTVNNIGDAT